LAADELSELVNTGVLLADELGILLNPIEQGDQNGLVVIHVLGPFFEVSDFLRDLDQTSLELVDALADRLLELGMGAGGFIAGAR